MYVSDKFIGLGLPYFLRGSYMGFGKDGRGTIVTESRSQALGALPGNGGIIIGTKLALLKDFRSMKVEQHAFVSGLTATEGIGMLLYLVDGAITLAEFEESIEAQGPLQMGDRPEQEKVMRFSKRVGAMRGAEPAVTRRDFENETGGALITVLPNWTFREAQGWNWIVYNHGQTLTTGATIKILSKAYGVWLA